MRSLNPMCGDAANGRGSAPSIVKFRSGMIVTSVRAFFQNREKCSDFVPHFGSAGKTFPTRTNDADEREALIDRDQEVFPSCTNAIDQQALHILLHARELGIAALNLLPRLERELRFDRAGGT